MRKKEDKQAEFTEMDIVWELKELPTIGQQVGQVQAGQAEKDQVLISRKPIPAIN